MPALLGLFSIQVEEAFRGFSYLSRQSLSLSLKTVIQGAKESQRECPPKVFRRELPNQMRTRCFRSVGTVCSLLLLISVPAQAGPITFADVVSVMGDLQKGGQLQRLRLRAVAQEPGAQGTTVKTPQPTGPVAPSPDVDPQSLLTSLTSGNGAVAPSLMSGTEVAPQQQQGDVQVFEQDAVDGTICDCGEIPPVVVAGGFPKWPFLFLIPLVCVTGVCSHHHHRVPPPEIPTPTPTPPIPEPATLLLFGTGIIALSASARRRYTKNRAKEAASAATEV